MSQRFARPSLAISLFMLTLGTGLGAQSPRPAPSPTALGTMGGGGGRLSAFPERPPSGPLRLRSNIKVIPGKQGDAIWEKTSEIVIGVNEATQIKLTSEGMVLLLLVSPLYSERNGLLLRANSQIWTKNPDGNLSYFTSFQAIPILLGEDIYYYPLGSGQGDFNKIEIVFVLDLPEGDPAETASSPK